MVTFCFAACAAIEDRGEKEVSRRRDLGRACVTARDVTLAPCHADIVDSGECQSSVNRRSLAADFETRIPTFYLNGHVDVVFTIKWRVFDPPLLPSDFLSAGQLKALRLDSS